MIGLGKQKGDANLLQQIGCFLWRKGDVDMQCLQGIRTSAFTRYAAVSMLVALLTMTLDAAAISAGLSFFIFIAIRNALTCSLLALPSIMIFMAVFISSVVRSWCSLTFLIYSFNIHSSSLSL